MLPSGRYISFVFLVVDTRGSSLSSATSHSVHRHVVMPRPSTAWRESAADISSDGVERSHSLPEQAGRVGGAPRPCRSGVGDAQRATSPQGHVYDIGYIRDRAERVQIAERDRVDAVGPGLTIEASAAHPLCDLCV